MRPILDYMCESVFMRLFGKNMYRVEFYNLIEEIVEGISNIEYLRMTGKLNDGEECISIESSKIDLRTFMFHLKPNAYSGFNNYKKVVGKCFSDMVYKTMLVENMCSRFRDTFEYADERRDLIYRANQRLYELEEMLSYKKVKSAEIIRWINRL